MGPRMDLAADAQHVNEDAMIRIFLEDCKWGTDVLDSKDGLQLNVLDEKSDIMLHVAFNDEALDSMIEMIEKYRRGENA